MQAFSSSWKRLATNIYNSKSVTRLKHGLKIAFSEKYLLYTNVTISVSLSAVGDLMEQSYEIVIKEQNKYDFKRTMHMAASGAALGVLCHYWYKVLDRVIVGKTVDMVAKKLFLDQMIFSPIMIITLFGSLALFEKNPVENFKVEVRDKFITLYRAEWMVWPPAQVALEMQAFSSSWKRLATNIYNSKSVTRLKHGLKIAFSEKYLLYTNVTISVSLSAVGDLMEQSYEIVIKEQNKYDFKRTMHMAASGAALGVLCHYWYKVLDRVIVGKTVDMVAKKLFLDQMIFSPIMIITLFGSLALFEKNPVENFKVEVRDKFITLYRAEWMVWPPAQVINFYYLPTRFRVLYDNTISLGYDVYTSQVKHQKPVKNVPMS